MHSLVRSLLFFAAFSAPVGVHADMSDQANAATNGSDATLTEAQIFDVLKASDEIEIKTGKVAKSRAHDSNIKALAGELVDDHEKLEDNAKKVKKDANIDAKESALSKKLEADCKTSVKELKGSGKADFDKNYIAQVIKVHQDTLRTIDDTLMPSAKSESVKQLLRDVRATVSDHLEKAKKLQS